MRKTFYQCLALLLSAALVGAFTGCSRQVDPALVASSAASASSSAVSVSAPVSSSSQAPASDTVSSEPAASSAVPESSSAAVSSSSEAPATLPEDGVILGQGLLLGDLSDYTGLYMEDGSNEIVTGIMSAIVTNIGENDLQLARISITYPDTVCEFEATNIPAGATVVLLEKNRKGLPGGEFTHASVDQLALFPEPMRTHADTFEISGMDGAINVKNISSKDIGGDIYVYYKYSAGDMYFGGITFRARVEGGLKAGEIRQIMTGHYDPDGCTITMVTYGE